MSLFLQHFVFHTKNNLFKSVFNFYMLKSAEDQNWNTLLDSTPNKANSVFLLIAKFYPIKR